LSREFLVERRDGVPLALRDFCQCFSFVEPSAAIDFRNLLKPAGLRRPFHGTGIDDEIFRHAISFRREGRHRFSPPQLEDAQRGEFALRGLDRIFLRAMDALGNGPHALVFVAPERTARMDQENFNAPAPRPIEQEASAHDLGQCGLGGWVLR
jgi:hypothetical protein